MGLKIIDGVEPFNDVYYIDCLYNSFFPIVKLFNKSIHPFLANDIFYFKFRVENGKLSPGMKSIPAKELSHLCNDLGITNVSKPKSDNLIHDIKLAIDNDRPVIIWIDCFYDPMRLDVYNKIHWAHTLLIYGYDDKSQLFNIIEHLHKDNLQYKHLTLEYNIVEKCNTEYFNNFYHGQFPTYHEFFVSYNQTINVMNESGNRESSQDILIENIVKLSDELKKSINDIHDFYKYYKEMSTDLDFLSVQGEYLLERLNKIINFRTMEKYRLEALFGKSERVVKIQEELIDSWTHFRLIIAKSYFSNTWTQKQIDNTHVIVKDTVELEEKFISYLTDDFARI